MKQVTMKNSLGSIKILFAAAYLGLLMACAQGSPVDVAPPAGVPISPINPITGSTTAPPAAPGASSSSSNTVTLNANTAQIQALFYNYQLQGQAPVSNPRGITISMSTYNSGSGYAGSVTISMTDDYGHPTATFSTTHPLYGSTSNAEYNVWLNSTQWHGFFQDLYSAIVVVIDHSIGLGDGGAKLLGGTVYFQNFNSGGPSGTAGGPNGIQGPMQMCWKITIGPYDCRTFLTAINNDAGTLPVTTSSLAPNNSGPGRPAYAVLGTFEGLSSQAALGN